MAVKAGYKVVCLDAFLDHDTQALANLSYRIPFENNAFNASTLLQVIHALALPSDSAFVYGSGFESNPQILDAVGERIPVLGNNQNVIAASKNWHTLQSVAEDVGCYFPETCSSAIQVDLASSKSWLVKKTGGAGGSHIRQWRGDYLSDGEYIQERIDGDPISLVFLANEENIQVLGVNALFVNPKQEDGFDYPFQYAGLLTNIEIDSTLRQTLSQLAISLTKTLKLRGVNSIDAIVSGDALYLLEVNPRLSASAYGYSTPSFSLMDAHILACQGNVSSPMPLRFPHVLIKILFAEFNSVIPENVAWPSEVMDVPHAGTRLSKGQPVCSMVVSKNSVKEVNEFAETRYSQLRTLLNSFATE